jgi:hypothetical protein
MGFLIQSPLAHPAPAPTGGTSSPTPPTTSTDTGGLTLTNSLTKAPFLSSSFK